MKDKIHDIYGELIYEKIDGKWRYARDVKKGELVELSADDWPTIYGDIKYGNL